MIHYLPEPSLVFGHEQHTIDPRDGLMLFGPFEKNISAGIQCAVIGTLNGINLFINWLDKIQKPIFLEKETISRPFFPGFEATFGMKWSPSPVLRIELDKAEIAHLTMIEDSYHRVQKLVDLYANKIHEAARKEEKAADIWFAIIPNEVKKYCRPRSVIPQNSVSLKRGMLESEAKKYLREPALFEEMNQYAEPYKYELNFHNQLKARMLDKKIVTQIILESTITPPELEERAWIRDQKIKQQPAIAWNICATAYYKCGLKPWKAGGIRSGVCYVGLVFKQLPNNDDSRRACCAAQMFLNSGDGQVFRGTIGPWWSSEDKQYHLSQEAAFDLLNMALETYKEKHGEFPNEIFLHGQTVFNADEWIGFEKAAKEKSNVVGICLRRTNDFKLFTQRDGPILRGTLITTSKGSAYLWANGFVPRLRTQQGLETPSPLKIDIIRGEANINIVAEDILALTKLNYNACIFSEGLPVTIRFADAVGEILTSGPMDNIPPLPFKFYI